MKILHIHQDFPDGTTYASTKAVSNLLDVTEHFEPSVEHFVLSIHRTSNPFNISIQKFERGISLVYWALPLPYIYMLSIKFWCWLIIKQLRGGGFSLIHAHKLTTEGMFAHFLSTKLQIKYFVSIRGGSDIHNIRRLKDCRPLFKQIFLGAKQVFWVSLWAEKSIQNYLGIKKVNKVSFPNICNIESMQPIPRILKKRYCTILNFDQYQRKGVVPLLKAIHDLRSEGYEIKLDIIGGGNAKNKEIVTQLILDLKLGSQVNVVGQLDREGVISYLQHSKGLLLPSIRETFGMAYVEAAACGCPFLYVKDTGIDGYFENSGSAVKIQDQTVESIREGIVKLEKHNSLQNSQPHLNANLHELKIFQKEYIVNTYLHAIDN